MALMDNKNIPIDDDNNFDDLKFKIPLIRSLIEG
jgi:hypothetical protein